MNITLKNGHNVIVGCHVDSHHGQYYIEMMADLIDQVTSLDQNYSADGATNYRDQVVALRKTISDNEGVRNDLAADEALVKAYEALDELGDKIENQLNDLLPDDSDYSFGWMEGDFGLYHSSDFGGWDD